MKAINMSLRWTIRYLLAVLPAPAIWAIWQLSEWAYTYLGCSGHIKALQPCHAGPIDLTWWLGIGLFWCQILWVPAIALSGWLVLRVYRQHQLSRLSGHR